MKPLFFNNRNDFRTWLKANYKIDSAWLLFYKKRLKKGMNYDEAVEEALCFGWIDGIMKSIDREKHMIRFSPRRKKSVWSLINKEKAETLIKQGKMAVSGLKKIEDAKKNGQWQSAYTNKMKERMPKDLKEALMENKVAWNNFQNFANSYQNMYIGWVVSAKAKETRERRIKLVVERSSDNRKAGY